MSEADARVAEIRERAAPRPWTASGAATGRMIIRATYEESGLRTTEWTAICNCRGQDNVANAELIIHAVNSHDELIAERDRLAAQVKEITTERDEAQSACMAWRHVFGSIEAHIGDRKAMGDPADPETYLSIIRGDVADIERRSRQIVAARWTAVRDAEAARNRLAARVAALEGALRRLDTAAAEVARISDRKHDAWAALHAAIAVSLITRLQPEEEGR